MKYFICIAILCFGYLSFAQESQQETEENVTYKAITFGYLINPNTSLETTDYYSFSSEKANYSYSFKDSFSLGFEWSQFNKNSWNHGISINYMNLKSDSTSTTSTFHGAVSKAELPGDLTIFSLGYSGKYRFENFYIPTQIAIATSSVDSKSRITQSLKPHALLSVGAGFIVHDRVVIEGGQNIFLINTKQARSGQNPDLDPITVSPNDSILQMQSLFFAIKILL